MWRDRTRVIGAIGVACLVMTGCQVSQVELGCKTDQECRGTRICVDGECQFSYDRGDEARTDTDDGDDRDTTSPTDTAPDPDPDTRLPPPLDTAHDSRTPPQPPPERDTAPVDDAPTEDAPTADTADAGGPQLTCHEFATCQAIMCEPYDYQCKDRFSSRTPQEALAELDARQQCVRDHCAETTGRERADCQIEHCESEFRTCGRDDDPSSYSCSEFHSCLTICNGRDDRAQCRRTCQSRTGSEAQRKLRQYHRCFSRNCQGEEGRDAWECARRHCASELATCWRC